MNEKEAIQQAATTLKDGGVILFPTETGWQLCFDASSSNAVGSLFEINKALKAENITVVLNSDRMINQCIKDVPEVAWDMIDYATEPLTVILDHGQFVDKRLLRVDQSLAIQKVTEGLTNNLLLRLNSPMGSTPILTKDDNIVTKLQKVDETLKEKVDFIFPERLKHSLKPTNAKELKIRTNGEVEIVRK